MTNLDEKLARRQRAIEGKPFGPGSATEHEGKTMSGAQAIIASLEAEGVDTIFGYPGGQAIKIYDALYDSKKIRHVLARHEQGATHMADGYARATGKVGVVLVTSGPGATNTVTGIATAFMDSVPLVVITGQVTRGVIGTDAFQESDIVGITMPVVKHSFLLQSCDDLTRTFREAFYIASTGRPGPVLIDIPSDLSGSQMVFHYPDSISIPSYKPTYKGNAKQVRQAANLIESAKRPLIYAGGGIVSSHACAELTQLAEHMRIPVVTSLMGKGAMRCSNPLNLGPVGMHGSKYANMAVTECDLLIAVGARFSDRVTGKVSEFAPHAKIIHIDIDSAELGKNLPVELPIHADAGEALEAMKSGIRHKDRSAWIDVAKGCDRREYEEVVRPSSDPQGRFISMYDAISTLAEVEKGDAVIVTDVGQNQMFSARYSKFNSTRSFITSGGLGTMGFGLPAALGAKLGVPDREVVCVMGDGGFQMTMQELGTIMQNRIGVKMIVLNNSYLGMVRQWQQLFFGKRYSFTHIESPDLTLIAAAYGIPNRRVTEPGQLREAIEELAAAPGAYLLEVAVLPEENVFPMVPAGASLSDIICTD